MPCEIIYSSMNTTWTRNHGTILFIVPCYKCVENQSADGVNTLAGNQIRLPGMWLFDGLAYLENKRLIPKTTEFYKNGLCGSDVCKLP
jgi:hypothetical protein